MKCSTKGCDNKATMEFANADVCDGCYKQACSNPFDKNSDKRDKTKQSFLEDF